MNQSNLPIALCNTGPLISAFQSDSIALFTLLFREIHTTEACITELAKHGWQASVEQARSFIVTQSLTLEENSMARNLAEKIAAHPLSQDANPAGHLGEAQVMALAQRSIYSETIILLDERAARAVALESGLNVSGFAGALILAVNEQWIEPEQVKARLEQCRRQGTPYSEALIERAYQLAQEAKV
ncbi:MAG: hypothetical protein HY741_02320 [Chloroflexi bacterium]|nr:hypothetical protein [Chloroflexota bacterium]